MGGLPCLFPRRRSRNLTPGGGLKHLGESRDRGAGSFLPFLSFFLPFFPPSLPFLFFWLPSKAGQERANFAPGGWLKEDAEARGEPAPNGEEINLGRVASDSLQLLRICKAGRSKQAPDRVETGVEGPLPIHPSPQTGVTAPFPIHLGEKEAKRARSPA